LVFASPNIPASSNNPTTKINGVSLTKALVKDTPLIFVVGLLELAGMLGLAKTNPQWLGFSMEGYVFAGIIFWIICYSMSKYSQKLELKFKTDR
jgi:general L-amino acid transport system permease protein